MPATRHNTSPSVSTTRSTRLRTQATLDRCGRLQPRPSKGQSSDKESREGAAKRKSKTGVMPKRIILSESPGVTEYAGSAEEDAEDMPQIIHDKESGMEYLQKAKLIDAGVGLGPGAMAGLLFRLAGHPDMPAAAVSAIKSAAYILAEVSTDDRGMTVTDTVENEIKLLVEGAAKKASDSITEATKAALEEIKAASAALTVSSAQIKATATSYSDALKSAQASPATSKDTLDARVRAREGIKSRQLLVDVISPGQDTLAGASNTELVEAANKALRDLDEPPHHRFVSARRLNNGGILLELDSEEAMAWLSDPLQRASFLGRFAPEASVKTRAFPLIVQFVPLYFKPEMEAELRAIEADNKLATGAVLRARWVKPAYRRALEQTCGHIILTLSTPETANSILTNGLVICQKRVYAEKCRKEPIRCLKCHGWGHLSYDCPQDFDTCGT